MVRLRKLIIFMFCTGSLIAACTKKTEPVENQSAAVSPIEQGRVLYMSRCIACHNSDPKLAGSLGPEVIGSSLELLKLKVTQSKYPAGYTPKRNSRIMVAMPDLKDADIEALHAFISSKN